MTYIAEHMAESAFCYQELHLHGNDIGNEGIRALMLGLAAHRGLPFTFLRVKIN